MEQGYELIPTLQRNASRMDLPTLDLPYTFGIAVQDNQDLKMSSFHRLLIDMLNTSLSTPFFKLILSLNFKHQLLINNYN